MTNPKITRVSGSNKKIRATPSVSGFSATMPRPAGPIRDCAQPVPRAPKPTASPMPMAINPWFNVLPAPSAAQACEAAKRRPRQQEPQDQQNFEFHHLSSLILRFGQSSLRLTGHDRYLIDRRHAF